MLSLADTSVRASPLYCHRFVSRRIRWTRIGSGRGDAKYYMDVRPPPPATPELAINTEDYQQKARA